MISKISALCLVMSFVLLLSFGVSNSFATGSTALGNLSGVAEQASAVAEGSSITELLNINSASPEMLAQIPGVGPKIGEAISAYREANGAFSQIKDLLNVDGIDMSLLEKIKPFITI